MENCKKTKQLSISSQKATYLFWVSGTGEGCEPYQITLHNASLLDNLYIMN